MNLFDKLAPSLWKKTTGRSVSGCLSLLIFILLPALAWAQSPPTGVDFQRTLVADGLDLSIGFEISEDGRAFVISKCGAFYGWHLDDGVAQQTSTLPNLRCEWEDGVLSLALDPDFTSNNYLYLQYTAPGSLTRVSRFRVNSDHSLDLDSEAILLEWVTGSEGHGHMGGDLLFDLDGNLLISTGDNMPASGYFMPGSEATAGNTNDLRGKVLRITPTADGGYTIPAGNLFAGDGLHRPEIYGMGFRNPFRMGLDPLTGYVYVGDVGPDASAAGPEGPMGMDEINELRQAGNYGWPYVLGFNEPYAGFDPNNLVNHHQYNTGATQLPPAMPAIWTVLHRAIMAGPVYRYDASVDNPYKLPPYYDGQLIFWDFNSSRFFTLDVSATQPQAEELPINTQGFQGAIATKLDPRTGQLYVLQWGSGCCDKEPYGNGALYRFDYIGNRDGGVNLALGSIATATSELSPHLAANAVDGDPDTRWESASSDPQTLSIDLLQEAAISAIKLVWEAAYSSEYVIEASADGVSWDLLVDERDGIGGTRLHIVSSSTPYRYVRLTGTARGTSYGHSLFEVEILAADEAAPPEELTEFAYLNMPHTLDTQFTDVPLLLSETGAFSDTANLIPSANLIPFAPNSELWSDRAAKLRWISIPAERQIGWHATDNWTYPQGTVAVKHFELPLDERNPAATKRLETRLIVTQANGRVYGVTYKWRADNSDAELLTSGELETIGINDSSGNTWSQTWVYPSPAECIDCHTAESAQILGLSTRQLNGPLHYPGHGTENQLVYWNNLDLFSPGFNNAQVAHFDRTVAITDTSASLEHRVKSYLDTNCANCHGTGHGGSQWDGRFNTPLSQMGIVDEQTTGIRNYFNDYGISHAQVVTSGSPETSILYIRDKSVDPNDRMPPIARALEHSEYIEVLEAWINSLGGSTPPGGGTVALLSEGKTATSSSAEGEGFAAANAFDGNPETRWASEFADPQWITVDLGGVYSIDRIVLHWEEAHASAYVIEGSVDGSNWSLILLENNGSGGLVTHENLTGDYRYVRLTGTERATPWGYSLWHFEVYGSKDATAQPVLLSLNKPVITSPIEGDYSGANAVDGDMSTRWASEFADNQFIQIDLGESMLISRVVLEWEAAYGSGYIIEVSEDASTWTEIYSTTTGTGGTEDLSVSGQGRYIRLTGTVRATSWGFSLWEFQVFGSPADSTPPPPVPQISIVSPLADQQYQTGDSVSLQVSVSDSQWFSTGGRYRYSLNGGSPVQVTSSAAVNLGVLPVGHHSLDVTLIDAQGQTEGDSRSVSFSVNQSGGGETPPTPSPAQLVPVGADASSGNAQAAIDGDTSTRWESASSDPQYIQLDMGQSVYFTRAVLNWEGAYARSYTIDVSDDGATWQTLYSTTSGNGGIDDLALNGGQGRYIRMHGTERATSYGYSLWEFEVHGLAADPNLALISIAAPAEGQEIPEAQSVVLQVGITDATWIASGGSYHYTLDNQPPVQVSSLDPVNLGVLPTGQHSLRVSLVNSDGVEVSVPQIRNFRVSCGNNCPNVLVFSKTNGFRHESIPVGIATVENIAAANGYSVTTSEDSSLFTEANLAQYSTVVFMNTTGDIFTESEKAAFQAYIEGGGGYVGIHSAADTEHNWGWYIQTLLGGAKFIHHGDGIPHARMEIEQPDHLIMNHIGHEWHLHEEWYFWESNPRNTGNIQILANLDRSSYPSNYPVEDHPVVFTNTVGDGRAFYTAKGHVDETFLDPRMIEMLRKAIEWTSGN